MFKKGLYVKLAAPFIYTTHSHVQPVKHLTIEISHNPPTSEFWQVVGISRHQKSLIIKQI